MKPPWSHGVCSVWNSFGYCWKPGTPDQAQGVSNLSSKSSKSQLLKTKFVSWLSWKKDLVIHVFQSPSTLLSGSSHNLRCACLAFLFVFVRACSGEAAPAVPA